MQSGMMGIIPEPAAVTAAQILTCLAARHPWPAWVFFTELCVGTGGGEQRLDAWAQCCYPSRRLARVTYEIKVSRSDFLRELRQPTKRAPGLALSNQFYFVTPPALLVELPLPPETGWMECDGTRCRIRRPAPWRDTPKPSWDFVASLARRAWETPPPTTRR